MLDRLKAAVVLADALTFHGAARRLGISQPQLTRIIKALEQELGVVLFERGPRGVTVTAQGQAALDEARSLLGAEDRFKRSISDIQSSSKRLSIGVGSYVAHSWAGTALTALARRGGVAVSVRDLDWWKLGDAVLNGEAEISVGELTEAERDPRLTTDLFRERVGLVVVRHDHPLAGRGTISLDDLASFPLAAPRLPSRMAEVLSTSSVMGRLSEDGRFYLPAIECSIPRSVVEVVASSRAIAMTLPEFCGEQLASREFVALPFRPPWLVTRQGLIYRRDAPLSELGRRFRLAAKVAERTHFRQVQGMATT
jgi:DNA-binding transcriptional LysR family regulator